MNMFKNIPRLSIGNTKKVLAILKELKQNKLVFELNSAPPTNEEIAERIALIRNLKNPLKDLKGLQELFDIGLFACNSGLFVFSVVFIFSLNFNIFLWIAFLFFARYGFKEVFEQMNDIQSVYRQILAEENDLAPVVKEDYELLLKACNATKGNKEYHEKIIKIQRQFVNKELELLRESSKDVLEKEVLNKLYPFQGNIEKEITIEKGYKL